MDAIEGRCLCGDVQFSYAPPSLWCGHCHCTLCQRAHGAPLVTWVGVPEGVFEFTRQQALRWYASSNDSERGFCSHCGTTLFFKSERWPGEMHVVRTALPEKIDLEPQGHTHWDTRAPWFAFHDELPHVEP